MKHLNIFLGNDIFEEFHGDIIAVDSFAVNLIDAGYTNFVAIGDFDSCTDKEQELLINTVECQRYSAEKDFGDFELAFIYARENGYESITVYNINCGARIDHFINNIAIVSKYKDEFDITVKDRNNEMFFIKNHAVIEKSKHKYISFMFYEDVNSFELDENFKYSFKGDVKAGDTRFISNELVGEKGCVSFKYGVVLAILALD